MLVGGRVYESQSKPGGTIPAINGCGRLFISLHGSGFTVFVPGFDYVSYEVYVAVGQNQWYHLGVGAPPILEPILVVGLGC